MMTPRQRDVLDAIRAYRTEHGLSPTIQEVADAVSLSKTAVAEHINALVEKELLKRGDPRKARTLEPANEELIAKEDAVDAVDQVMTKKRSSDKVGRLGTTLKRAINAIQSRS